MTRRGVSARINRSGLAMMISISDLFFGLAAIVMILIVLSSSDTERRMPAFTDQVVGCALSDTSAPQIIAAQDDPMPLAQWIAGLSPADLILRVGVRVGEGELGCFEALKEAVAERNVSMDTETQNRPVVALTMLPIDPDATDAQ